MGFNELWSKIKAHPYIAAIIVFVVGLIIVYWYMSGSSSSGSGAGAASSYYGAQASELASQNQLAAEQAAIQAQTAQYQYAEQAAIAPYQYEAQLGEEQSTNAVTTTENTNSTLAQIAATQEQGQQAALNTVQAANQQFETGGFSLAADENDVLYGLLGAGTSGYGNNNISAQQQATGLQALQILANQAEQLNTTASQIGTTNG